ncbi:MAG: HAD family hydrolase [Planctomycetes bacterium]|nr:HAD family hydrolase [Planctomycetota bacterium]
MRPDSIRCIAFDAVGTLIEPHPPVAVAYAHVGRRYGSRLSEPEIADRFRAAFAAHQRPTGDVRGFSERPTEAEEREWWRNVVRQVIDDARDPEACFEDLFAHFASPHAWRCFPDVAAGLRRLKAAGRLLAVASNFDGRLNRLCDDLPELAPLDLRVISSEVGCRKPSPEFYASLVERAGCDASEVLMVGDDVANDVAAACDAGLHAVHLDRRAAADPQRIAPQERAGDGPVSHGRRLPTLSCIEELIAIIEDW